MADLSAPAIKRRLGSNVLATLGSQGAGVYQQLATVPVLLWAWGAEAYGVWITLFSVFSYLLVVVQFGFVDAVASEVGMRCAEGKTDEALVVFQSVLRLVVVVSVVCVVLGCLCAVLVPVGPLLRLDAKWNDPVRWLLGLLLVQVPFNYLGAFCTAIYRGAGQMARGMLYNWTIIRILESTAAMVAAALGGGIVHAAAAMFAVRAVLSLALLPLMRRQIPWTRIGFRHASWGAVVGLLRPGFGHMALPISLVMSAAGVNVLVSVFLGPAAVAAVSIVRTLGNLAFQAFNMLLFSVWPEISALVGAGSVALARRVVLRFARIAFFGTVAVCVVLAATAEQILRIWTAGRVPIVWGVLGFQLVAIVVACLWRVPSVTLLATNRNARMGVFALLSSAVTIGLAATLIPVWGATGVGVSLLAAELIMLFANTRRSLQALDCSYGQYARTIFGLAKAA